MSPASITGPLVLASDVIIIPAASFPADIQSRLEGEPGEYVITRPRSRSVSRVIGADAAELLTRFRVPATVAEAVVDYSRVRAADPKSTAADVLPLIRDLLASRLLMPAGLQAGDEIRASLHAGDRVGAMTVHRVVHVLEDVEVYQGRADDGTSVALKIGRREPEAHAQAAFRREAAILRYLDARSAPRLLEASECEARQFLVLEWCAGVDADAAAAEYRLDGNAESRSMLVRLCAGVLDAYVGLHELGVQHGDVHPCNVLIDASWRARLIDYAFARAYSHTIHIMPPSRIGIGFFFEPEYAHACRIDAPPPAVTAAGEQYAVAALLYSMLTGVHYLDFSLEQREALRQIEEEHPVPFARRGVTGWKETEAILAIALRKDPADRYDSLAALADAFRIATAADTCLPSANEQRSTANRGRPRDEWTDRALARFDLGSPALADGSRTPPICSVTYGAAGVGYALYRIALLHGDAERLALADVWCAAAERDIDHAHAFWSEAENITHDSISAASTFYAAPGVHVVRALVAHACGDPGAYAAASARFVEAMRTRDDRPDLTLDLTRGTTGSLLAAALLLEAAPRDLDPAPLIRVGEDALSAVWVRARHAGPVAHSDVLRHAGMAHGWAGVLYTTMRWCAAARIATPAELPGRLSELADLATPVGRGLAWPRFADEPFGDDEMWPGWCRGSAGFVHLWSRAFQTTGANRFLSLAEGAGWHAWEDPNTYPDLCCGLAGRAYALLELYKLTHDQQWLRRAERLAATAVGNADTLTSHPDSLYKGRVGVALLQFELERPDEACMPFFGAEGWPAQPD